MASKPQRSTCPKTAIPTRTAHNDLKLSGRDPLGIESAYAGENEEVVARDGAPTQAQTQSRANSWRIALSDPENGIWLYQGNCLTVLEMVARRHPEGIFDVIFADPPYFLSNGGITCHAGRMVTVDKGKWDKSRGPNENHDFNLAWLGLCRRVLKPDGTIWVSGTAHVIHSVGFAMQQLGFKILNDVTWVKPNPPPNLSCRYLTHATETIIWAAKSIKSKHYYNYELMKEIAGGKQMKSVWEIRTPTSSEKKYGKHPTQKPLALLKRLLQASSRPGDLVLDPFLGSGTTAVAAIELKRRTVGVELQDEYVKIALKRISEAIDQNQDKSPERVRATLVPGAAAVEIRQ